MSGCWSWRARPAPRTASRCPPACRRGHHAPDVRLRGPAARRYSLDDGATWTKVGSGFPLSGLSAPGIGVSAYNGTGAEVGTFDFFHVGEPPEVPPPPPCAEPYTPEAGYTMLFDGTDESLEDWTYAGGGSFVREDCAIKSVGAFGLLYTKQEFEAPYSLKLEWMMPGDDNSGIFVGFSDTGANTDQTSITQGEEIQIDATDDPAQHHRCDLQRAGARTLPPATRP